MWLSIVYVIILAILQTYTIQQISGIIIVLKKEINYIVVISIVFYAIANTNIIIRTILSVITMIILAYHFLRIDMYNSIIVALIAYFIMTISDTFAGVILYTFLGYERIQISNDLRFQLMAYVIMSAAVIIIVKISRKLTHFIYRNKSNDVRQNFTSIAYVLITLALNAVIIYPFNFMPEEIFKGYLVASLLVTISYLLINGFVIYKNNESIRQNEEYEQLKVYTEIIEGLTKDLRKFKHDYINMMTGLNGYLMNDDLEGLKHYFYEEVMKDSDVVYNNTINLHKIKNSGLKALVASKITEAENKGLNVKIDIEMDIEYIPMRTIDICKVIGVLLDNAIEAASESEDKVLMIGSIYSGMYLIFIIANSYKNLPNLKDIYTQGFSTKGTDRGIGLNNVKELLSEKYDNVLLNTIIENSMFKQELNIKIST